MTDCSSVVWGLGVSQFQLPRSKPAAVPPAVLCEAVTQTWLPWAGAEGGVSPSSSHSHCKGWESSWLCLWVASLPLQLTADPDSWMWLKKEH